MEFKQDDECSPVAQEKENKYHSADYNCSNCDQIDCFYWHFYHFEPDE